MDLTRRNFMGGVCLGAAAVGINGAKALAEDKPIQGFEDKKSNTDTAQPWIQKYDRKVRVGIVGYGVCKFGAAFGFQDHPNVEIVAVSDLFPDRCAKLAKACRCEKTYPSLEELVKDDRIEAVFVATDAPSHGRHAVEVLKHGKHVASAVPVTYGSLEEADQVFEAVKTSKLNYMMFETSAFHNDLYAMRTIYNNGDFGKLIYSEGEYYHFCPEPIASYKDWRVGGVPQWYPTHSNAYYVAVTGGSFTEVTCMGIPSLIDHLKPENNAYKNPFGTEIALFRTSEGGMSRMAVSWDTPGQHGEMGRIRGEKGSFYDFYDGHTPKKKLPNTQKPPLPPTVDPGSHGGSHGYLMDEFVMSIIENRKPLVDIAWSLNMTVSGIMAHQSAMKGGELMKIPQYCF
jgi:predicted dehydrogenase